MIEVIEGVRPGESKLLDQAFRHRHRIFVEKKGWSALRKEDGREVDQFDTPATVHFIAPGRGPDEVAGYVRLNPTIGPHLLADIHAHLCARPYRRAPDVWEWSRYSVADNFRLDGTYSDVASALLIAGLEWAEPQGIHTIVLEFHPVWITRFRELDFEVIPLGLPVTFEGELTLAAQLGFDRRTIKTMRRARGFRRPVLKAKKRRFSGVAA